MPKAKTKGTAHNDGRTVGQSVRKPRNKNRLSRLGEYDEDPGRAGSQRYRKMADTLKKVADKSEAFLEEFQSEIKKRDVQLKAFRREKEKEFAKDQQKYSTMMNQLSQQLPDRKHGRLGALRKEDHPLFQKAQADSDGFKSVLKQLKTMEERLQSEKLELPITTWKQDEQDTKELLAYGGRYGETLLGGVLAPELAANPEINLTGTSEKDQRVKELFRNEQKPLDEETWGHIAEDQLRQLSAIARTLPSEERKDSYTTGIVTDDAQ
ncbi:hypothetical protein F5Y03DRAFT_399782 [Xylaria venustula]|nr:hypothetical protein F5Y03DRAFT_399782 [Xylaria venustula]